jgi:hypothetical protein
MITVLHSENSLDMAEVAAGFVGVSPDVLAGVDLEIGTKHENVYTVIRRDKPLYHYRGYIIAPKHLIHLYNQMHVHGGWTWEENGIEAATKLLEGKVTLDPKIEWGSIGFDCAHYGDRSWSPPSWSQSLSLHQTYRTADYVRDELETVLMDPKSFTDLRSLANGDELDKAILVDLILCSFHEFTDECGEYIKTFIERLTVKEIMAYLLKFRESGIDTPYTFQRKEREEWGPIASEQYVMYVGEMISNFLKENPQVAPWAEGWFFESAANALSEGKSVAGVDGVKAEFLERFVSPSCKPFQGNDWKKESVISALASLESRYNLKGGV